MARPSNNTTRVELRVPEILLTEIDKYQENELITTRAAAMFELLRIGLKATKKE